MMHWVLSQEPLGRAERMGTESVPSCPHLTPAFSYLSIIIQEAAALTAHRLPPLPPQPPVTPFSHLLVPLTPVSHESLAGGKLRGSSCRTFPQGRLGTGGTGEETCVWGMAGASLCLTLCLK